MPRAKAKTTETTKQTKLYRRKKKKSLTLWDKVARGAKSFFSPCRKK